MTNEFWRRLIELERRQLRAARAQSDISGRVRSVQQAAQNQLGSLNPMLWNSPDYSMFSPVNSINLKITSIGIQGVGTYTAPNTTIQSMTYGQVSVAYQDFLYSNTTLPLLSVDYFGGGMSLGIATYGYSTVSAGMTFETEFKFGNYYYGSNYPAYTCLSICKNIFNSTGYIYAGNKSTNTASAGINLAYFPIVPTTMNYTYSYPNANPGLIGNKFVYATGLTQVTFQLSW